ncbi:SMI1/KNR4 family protein [Streptomyces sp. NPDC059063]|uniref:SMI1/KNR4 family protein n=1 Tax=unclassified Streptomyces TaxID=2593676 RepID=UPI00367B6E4B
MAEMSGTDFDWRPFLTRWSGEWADACDPDDLECDGDEEALRARWLGFAPATPARITALEERMGRRLPPSYRTFLEVSDGWRHAGGFVMLLAGTEDARWQQDERGLSAMFLEHLDEDAPPEEIRGATVWSRGLGLDVESDATSVALDPEDVDEHGEWAVYTWAPWRAEPPERHGSFREFMQAMYRQFHHLAAGRDEGPAFVNATTEALDARVEGARVDALRGDFERADAALAEALDFGRPRAGALRDQLKWFLGDRYSTYFGGLAADPVYAPDLLPAVLAERIDRHWGNGAYESHVRGGAAEVLALERDLLERLRAGTYVCTAPGLFGDAVATAREQARWGDTDAAWRTLLAALPQWRPLGPDHLAPVGLTADPLLGPLLTQTRGRALLATPRGEAATGATSAAVDEDPGGLAWLAERPENRRESYRFVLVEGVEPAALPGLIGAEEDGALREPMRLWDARRAWWADREDRKSRPPDADPSSPAYYAYLVSTFDDEPLVAVGRAGDGWSFAYDGEPRGFDAERFTSPAVAASRHGRAVVVWGSSDRFDRGALFHLSVAEHGEERYAYTIQGESCEHSGEIPEALDPHRLFPELRGGGRHHRLPGEAAALTAIADEFGVTLPRFALDRARLHTFTTRSWARRPEPGETFTVLTFHVDRPGTPDG